MAKLGWRIAIFMFPALLLGTGLLGAGPVGASAAPKWVATPTGRVVVAPPGAPQFGDLPELGIRPAAPIVSVAPTPNGKGYWLVGADGGVFAFGDAQFYGSMGGKHLNAPIVGLQPTPDGKGYFLLGADGGVFAFGDAHFTWSLAGQPLPSPATIIRVTMACGVAVVTGIGGAGWWSLHQVMC